ncbi:MAG: hypothetical protein RL026_566 [Pseudomonadota bacterium]|jgi:hypothetical protein
MKPTFFRHALAACALGALAACGGGGSDVSPSNEERGPQASDAGTAFISLTDAPGDFVSYIVNVTSIKLKKADGTVVETLPAATQVDFAELVQLSEVVTAKQIPSGTYVSAQMTVDFAGATIAVDNGSGSLTVEAGKIINGTTNNPLLAPDTTMTLDLQLPAGQPFVVTRGTVNNLSLDFNLAASNAVAPSTIDGTTPAGSVTVTVNPVVSATVQADATKELRVRGPLGTVTNTATDTSFTVRVKPFHKGGSSDHGTVTVKVTDATTYAINGSDSTGAAGLTALAALPADTLVAAGGTFDKATRTFTATTVQAGNSVFGAGLDGLEGTVVARTGDVITVRNARHAKRNRGGVEHLRSVQVTLGSGTRVSAEGKTGSFTAQDVSVGQHLYLFGTMADPVSGQPRTMDATTGYARLGLTKLWGRYTSSASGVVTLGLTTLDGWKPAYLNFAGTGSTGNDATAAAYTVGVPASFNLANLTAGLPVSFVGHVNSFGAAPPAFKAVTLVNYAESDVEIEIEWDYPGVTAPFVAPLSASNVVINQATLLTAEEVELKLGRMETDLSPSANGLTIVPKTGASFTAFAIAHRRSRKTNNYASFDDMIAALNTALNGTTTVHEIEGKGSYDSATGTLSVSRLVVVLND